MGYTATWAGFAAAPIGILSLVLSPIIGRNLHRLDPRVLVSFAFIVFAGVNFWNAGFNTDVSFGQLVWPRFVQGIGVATFFVPLISIVLSGLPANRVASASGLSNFFRILGGSFGTSLSITLWDRREILHHSQLTESITAYSPGGAQALDKLQALGLPQAAALEQLDRTVTHQAYMLSTNDLFWLSGWIFLALLILIWLTRPPFTPAASGAEH